MKEKLNKFSTACKDFKAAMIKRLEKPVSVCKLIFGYGIMISLFAGGALCFAYIAAFCIGGETATEICAFIKKYVIPTITYSTTILVLFGLLLMYLSGEVALSAKKTEKKK